MPRAVDPSLFGMQLPITHSPLNRIDYRTRIPDGFTPEQLIEGAKTFIEQYLFPTIEELTGIDLSAFLPLLDLLDLDFSSPTAFFQSLINAVLLLPEIVLLFLQTLVQQLIEFPETFAEMISGFIQLLATLPSMMTELLAALVPMLLSLPTMLLDLLAGLVEQLRDTTGIDLTGFVEMFDSVFEVLGIDISGSGMDPVEFLTDIFNSFDFSSPTAFINSLIALVGEVAAGISYAVFDTILGITGSGPNDVVDWALGLIPFVGAQSSIPIVGSGQIQDLVQNLLMNPFFETAGAFLSGAGINWDGLTHHSPTGGSALFTPDGTAKSLIGNAISVVPGDLLDLSVWTKWDGLTGSGPISLIVNAYDAADNLIGAATQVISAIATPGLAGAWTQLSGSYTVPAGVSSVAASFNVSALLNGGSVWFDDGSVTKPNLVLPGIIGGPGGLLDNLPDEWTLLFDTLGDGPAATITQIENRLADMLNDLSILNADNILTGNIVTDRIEDLQSNFNNLVTALLGWDPPDPGTWYDPSTALDALTSQASSVLGHGGLLSQHGGTLSEHISNFVNLFTRVNTLETAGGGSAGPPPTGTNPSDDFERSGAIGSNWSNSDSVYQLDGHNAYWNVTSYSSRTAECRYTALDSASDYQIINIVIGNIAPRSVGSIHGWNYVHGRMGGGNKCTFAVRSDGYWEFRVNSSVYASGTGASLGIGSNMTLYCGEKGTSTLNKFICTVNNATTWSGTASSSTGSGYRGWGFGSGMSGTGSYPFGSFAYGGKVNQWSAADQ